MRSLILMFLLSTINPARACEVLLGTVLTPEQLRPNMVVEVVQTPPTLDESDVADTLEPDLGLDTYLESVDVRGRLLVRRVTFNPNDTLEVEVVALGNLERTAHGDYRVKDGVTPKRLLWSHRVPRGTGESARYRVIEFGRGDGEYVNLETAP